MKFWPKIHLNNMSTSLHVLWFQKNFQNNLWASNFVDFQNSMVLKIILALPLI